MKGHFYFWGERDKYSIMEPEETNFNCAEDLFANYFEITVKPLEYQFHVYESFIPNGKYVKNWLQLLPLGIGSYGETYKVQHKLTHENYAIKKIPFKDDNHSIKELVNSEKILQFKNEFLVKYFDVWYENDFSLKNRFRQYNGSYTIYIQMELCEESLKAVHDEISENSKLNFNNSLTDLGYFITSEIFVEILQGVHYLHRENYIHRDFNLDNILLKIGFDDRLVKIADFGHVNRRPSCEQILEKRYEWACLLSSFGKSDAKDLMKNIDRTVVFIYREYFGYFDDLL